MECRPRALAEPQLWETESQQGMEGSPVGRPSFVATFILRGGNGLDPKPPVALSEFFGLKISNECCSTSVSALTTGSPKTWCLQEISSSWKGCRIQRFAFEFKRHALEALGGPPTQ